MTMTLSDALQRLPLVAVLRGISPDEAEPVGAALIEAGFTIMEAPLNSPEPYRTIELLGKTFGDRAITGAGTVLRPDQVERVANYDGRICVSPSLNEEVVRATRSAGMISMPGVFTPSEAFRALEAGADALKLFPGDAMSPKVVKALRAVLPPETILAVTGGVDAGNLADFIAAGSNGVGIGSALYKPGKPVEAVAEDARRFVEAARRAA